MNSLGTLASRLVRRRRDLYPIASGIAGAAVLVSFAVGDGHDDEHMPESVYMVGHQWDQRTVVISTASLANYGTEPLVNFG